MQHRLNFDQNLYALKNVPMKFFYFKKKNRVISVLAYCNFFKDSLVNSVKYRKFDTIGFLNGLFNL